MGLENGDDREQVCRGRRGAEGAWCYRKEAILLALLLPGATYNNPLRYNLDPSFT
jgi:hypothetical protein